MIDKVLHTPEGVRDIYNDECEKKRILTNGLHQALLTYGYHDIETPTFEYFDIFSEERGTISSKYMYKFFDREGNTLVLRPDHTPSIARCAAKYYKEEQMPIRLCYMGNTYINNNGYQGKLKESTQLGAELMNDPSIDADAEMIAMSINCLLQSGLTEFQMEIGQVEFFKGLVEEAGLNAEEEENLRQRIEKKNMFAVEEILQGKEISDNLKELFLKLPQLFGPMEQITQVKMLTKNKRALKAIENLEQIYKYVSLYNLEKYITFDLGMLSKYNYYTSIIFRAYTYGMGDSVLGGGRYDNLVEQFGKKAPAIGMAINVDQLMMALNRQKKLPEPEHDHLMVVYREKDRKEAIELATSLRSMGRWVELNCMNGEWTQPEIIEHAAEQKIESVMFCESDGNVKRMSIKDREEKSVTMDEVLQLERRP